MEERHAGIIKDGEEEVVPVSSGLVSGPPARVDLDSDLVSGLGHPNQPGLVYPHGRLEGSTRWNPTRADSVADARALLAWPCLGSPDSESGQALPVSWVTV